MYRQYENPRTLEKRLEELKERRAQSTDEYECEGLDQDIAELEDRVNFAWQDEEYEEDYARENYPEEYAKGEWR